MLVRGGRLAVVGAVSQLYQGDWDFGRHLLARLEAADLGADVALEPFDYGAVAVVQRLEELAPSLLVLVGTAERRRSPGTVTRRCLRPLEMPPSAVGQAVADAVVGHVTLDLLVEVASGLGALPADAVAIELEPARGGPCEELSPQGEAALDEAIALVRGELARVQSPAAGSSAPTA